MIATTNYCNLQKGRKGRVCFMLALFSCFTVSVSHNYGFYLYLVYFDCPCWAWEVRPYKAIHFGYSQTIQGDKKCKKSVHWYSISLMGLIYREMYTVFTLFTTLKKCIRRDTLLVPAAGEIYLARHDQKV